MIPLLIHRRFRQGVRHAAKHEVMRYPWTACNVNISKGAHWGVMSQDWPVSRFSSQP